MTAVVPGPERPHLPPPEWPAHPPDAPPTADSPPSASPPTPSSGPGGPAPPPAPGRTGRGDDRTALAVVVAAVAAALLALGNAAAWVAATGTDRDTYADARLLSLEDGGGLRGLVRDRVTEVVLAWVDVPERAEAALPGPLSMLGGPAEDLAGLAVREAVDVALGQPEVEAVISRLERSADDELARLLFDEAEWLRLDGDVVVLDLDPVVVTVVDRLDELLPGWASRAGLDAGDLVPDAIDGGGLEVAVGRVDVLLDARDALAGLDRLARRYVLPGAALGLGALLLARRRRPVLVGFGATLAVVALLVGTDAGIAAFFGDAIGPLDEVAGQPFTSIDSGLGRRTALAVGAGLVLVATAQLAGRLPTAGARRAGRRGPAPRP